MQLQMRDAIHIVSLRYGASPQRFNVAGEMVKFRCKLGDVWEL